MTATLQDREGEGSKAGSNFSSNFSSGLNTPSNPAAPGSPVARPGSPNLLAMLLQTSYQPLVPGKCCESLGISRQHALNLLLHTDVTCSDSRAGLGAGSMMGLCYAEESYPQTVYCQHCICLISRACWPLAKVLRYSVEVPQCNT